MVHAYHHSLSTLRILILVVLNLLVLSLSVASCSLLPQVCVVCFLLLLGLSLNYGSIVWALSSLSYIDILEKVRRSLKLLVLNENSCYLVKVFSCNSRLSLLYCSKIIFQVLSHLTTVCIYILKCTSLYKKCINLYKCETTLPL